MSNLNDKIDAITKAVTNAGTKALTHLQNMEDAGVVSVRKYQNGI